MTRICLYLVTQIRLTDKRYARDNRLMVSESSYRRDRLAPRCRLITSWLWRGFQGFVCSPIKVVRELGLDRCEAGWSLSTSINLILLIRPYERSPNWRAMVSNYTSLFVCVSYKANSWAPKIYIKQLSKVSIMFKFFKQYKKKKKY